MAKTHAPHADAFRAEAVELVRASNKSKPALAERFFATRGSEQIARLSGAARRAAFAWIAVFSNRQRLHSALGDPGPAAFAERSPPMPVAAEPHTVHQSGATPMNGAVTVLLRAGAMMTGRRCDRVTWVTRGGGGDAQFRFDNIRLVW
jgi:hypothetical protein